MLQNYRLCSLLISGVSVFFVSVSDVIISVPILAVSAWPKPFFVAAAAMVPGLVEGPCDSPANPVGPAVETWRAASLLCRRKR